MFMCYSYDQFVLLKAERLVMRLSYNLIDQMVTLIFLILVMWIRPIFSIDYILLEDRLSYNKWVNLIFPMYNSMFALCTNSIIHYPLYLSSVICSSIPSPTATYHTVYSCTIPIQLCSRAPYSTCLLSWRAFSHLG